MKRILNCLVIFAALWPAAYAMAQEIDPNDPANQEQTPLVEELSGVNLRLAQEAEKAVFADDFLKTLEQNDHNFNYWFNRNKIGWLAPGCNSRQSELRPYYQALGRLLMGKVEGPNRGPEALQQGAHPLADYIKRSQQILKKEICNGSVSQGSFPVLPDRVSIKKAIEEKRLALSQNSISEELDQALQLLGRAARCQLEKRPTDNSCRRASIEIIKLVLDDWHIARIPYLEKISAANSKLIRDPAAAHSFAKKFKTLRKDRGKWTEAERHLVVQLVDSLSSD